MKSYTKLRPDIFTLNVNFTLSGTNASEIDFLTNHDAGDAVGDSAVRGVVLFLFYCVSIPWS